MIFKNIIIIFIMLIFISGCEQNVVENDLEFNEKLVVRALLEAGKPIEVYFARTLPLQDQYDTLKANLEDVVAVIIRRGVEHKLEHIKDGRYRAGTLIAENGESYKLFVEWNGKVITAETRVPSSTTFQNGRVTLTIENETDSVYNIEGLLTPREGAVYGVTWSVFNAQHQFSFEDDVIPVLLREEDKDLQNRLLLRTREIPGEIIKQWRNSLFIRVHAFDEQFYNFFITQDANRATSNIFSQSGINLRWNVTGDAIGMFIGKTDFIIKIP